MDRYMLFPSGMGQHPNGAYVLYTDAQATIAALQARVQELENELGCPTWICDCCGRVSSMGWINIVNETMDGIDYAMECPNCHTRQIEEDSAADLVRERDEFESQLTQRTAELEAANKLLYKKNCELGRFETIISDLQAELERVRGELVEAKDFLNTVTNDLNETAKERDDLRALVAALPKVEGEIRLIHADDGDWHVVDLYDAIFTDKSWAVSYAALLQHRQGMEG